MKKQFTHLISMLLVVALSSAMFSQLVPGFENQLFLVFALGFIVAGYALRNTIAAFDGPSSVAASYFQNYVSGFDLNLRKILPELYRRYNNQGREFIDMVLAMGNYRMSDVSVIEHFEENLIWEKLQVLSGSAGAAGAAVNVTLAPSSLDANNRYYARVNDQVLFKDGSKGIIKSIDVTTPTAPVMSIVPLKSANNIPAVSNNETIIIYSNIFSEGSTQPSNAAQGAYLYQNGFQIVKESVGASGSQMTDASWVETVDGKGIKGWFNKAVTFDLDHRMAVRMQGAILEGEEIDNPLAIDTLNDNASLVGQGTEGLFPLMRRVSIPYPYSPGSLTTTDVDAIDKLLNKKYAPAYVAGMLGQDVDIELTDVLKDYFAFTGIDYTTKVANNKFFGGDADGDALSAIVQFQYFKKSQGGRTYCFKRFGALQDPQTYGATGFDYTGKAVWIPMDAKVNPKNGKAIPSLGIVFKGMGGYSRKMEMFDIGGAGNGPKQTPVDRRDYYQRSEIGFEAFGADTFVDMYVS